MGEKSSFFTPKVSKNLNRAREIEKMLAVNSAGVTNLQYFCALKKDCLIVYTNHIIFLKF